MPQQVRRVDLGLGPVRPAACPDLPRTQSATSVRRQRCGQHPAGRLVFLEIQRLPDRRRAVEIVLLRCHPALAPAQHAAPWRRVRGRGSQHPRMAVLLPRHLRQHVAPATLASIRRPWRRHPVRAEHIVQTRRLHGCPSTRSPFHPHPALLRLRDWCRQAAGDRDQ
ncbi:MAG: hypothetical protein LKE81_00110 [Acetobacter sp.]|nr:hypothetical protein [Acetobacter sp.]